MLRRIGVPINKTVTCQQWCMTKCISPCILLRLASGNLIGLVRTPHLNRRPTTRAPYVDPLTPEHITPWKSASHKFFLYPGRRVSVAARMDPFQVGNAENDLVNELRHLARILRIPNPEYGARMYPAHVISRTRPVLFHLVLSYKFEQSWLIQCVGRVCTACSVHLRMAALKLPVGGSQAAGSSREHCEEGPVRLLVWNKVSKDIYIYIYLCTHIYIYTQREREVYIYI